MRKLSENFHLIIAGIIIAPFILQITLKWVGVYLGEPGWYVAKIAVEKENLKLCTHVYAWPWQVTQPGSKDRQRLCIFDYARLAQDPTACELLMPSSYGMACVGAAEDSDPCVMLADGQKTVKGQGIVTTYETCLSGDATVQTHVCCKMANVLYGESTNCEEFPEGKLRDQCHHIQGLRNLNIHECEQIQNERNRKGCEIIVESKQK